MLCLCVSFAWFDGHSRKVCSAERPNIVFVLADDLGWTELGCYGNDFNETPHLDQLADQGMRFTQAYAAAPVCSPYRAAWLTGQSPARLGITDYLRPNTSNALSTAHVTLPEMLRRAGYVNGMVGKWHLTGYRYHGAEFETRPVNHGFDWNVASEVKGVGNGANFWPYVFRSQPIRWLDLSSNRLGENEYLTDRLNSEAVDFIERHQDRPFFLYLSHYAPHTILNGREELVQKYREKHAPGKSGRDKCYLCEDAGLGLGDPLHHWATEYNPHLAAMLESIDQGIGAIDTKLRQLGLAENTILIFTSDNGGETNVTSNAPLRGGKSQLYEGGIRVPLIVRWPDQVPKGTVSSIPTVNTDFFPTLMEAVGMAPDPRQPLDGVSVLANWRNPDAKQRREQLAWHYPLDAPHFLGGVSGGAIRVGDWKLIENFDTGDDELYWLADDVSETRNLADEHPERVAELKSRLDSWRDEVGARNPSPPILTKPRELYFGDHFEPGFVSERLWYTKDWVAEEGILQRVENGSETTRIFLRDAEYQDAVIRFDFRMGESRDVRLVTGSGGNYNTVIHIRPDHFFIQTAADKSAGYFSVRHGECGYAFEPERWYTMTVEFLGDEVMAHLDSDHLSYAKHPIVDRTRRYFAIQVDKNPAAFDNVQIFKAAAKKGEQAAAGRARLADAMGKFPVEKSLEQQLQIQKKNAHAWYYRHDETYRNLVDRVDQLDLRNKTLFPDVFRTHKESKKQIADKRKRLSEQDSVFKQLLTATHRADRAVEAYLIAQQPEIADWPNSRKRATMERLRVKFAETKAYQSLEAAAAAARAKLVADYPEVFITDEEIKAAKHAVVEKTKQNPDLRKARQERAEAYRAQRDYLLTVDKKLAELERLSTDRPN